MPIYLPNFSFFLSVSGERGSEVRGPLVDLPFRLQGTREPAGGSLSIYIIFQHLTSHPLITHISGAKRKSRRHKCHPQRTYVPERTRTTESVQRPVLIALYKMNECIHPVFGAVDYSYEYQLPVLSTHWRLYYHHHHPYLYCIIMQ